MKLYLVLGSTWFDALPFGVYDTKHQARKRIEALKAVDEYKSGWSFEVIDVELNQDIEEVY
jgi:hypothetical protein